MTAQQQLVPRDGPGSVAGRVVFQGFGAYNLLYFLSFAARGIGALLGAMLRPPRAPWCCQWSQRLLAVEGT